MKKDHDWPTADNALRRRAEELLHGQAELTQLPQTEEEIQSLCHELKIHQIELELQRAELRQAWDAAESALRKFTDLYDFAPVGYFSLNRDGVILDVNLSGADLLGMDCFRLIGRRFLVFIAYDFHPTFNLFLDKVFAGSGKEACELALMKNDKTPLFVRIKAIANDSGKECLLEIMNITEHREKERLLFQQGRLMAMVESLCNISNQWRQPLNTLWLTIQQLGLSFKCGTLNEEYLDGSIESAMDIILNMSHTIDDFLNITRPDEMKNLLEPSRAVAEFASLNEDIFRSKHIKSEVGADCDNEIKGRQNDYTQLLFNILTKARDASIKRKAADERVVRRKQGRGAYRRQSLCDSGKDHRKDI